MRFGVRNQIVWGQEWTWLDDENETEQGGWWNPLTHRDGFFFSPKFRRSDMAKSVIPPPVVLDDDWETVNIDAQVIRPESDSDQVAVAAGGHSRQLRAYRAGSLRIYTLSGLHPSTTSLVGRSFGIPSESKVILLT